MQDCMNIYKDQLGLVSFWRQPFNEIFQGADVADDTAPDSSSVSTDPWHAILGMSTGLNPWNIYQAGFI